MSDIVRVKQEILDHVEKHESELVNFLSELVRIPSVFPPGEYGEISQLLAREYEALGLRVGLVSAPKEAVEQKSGLTYPRPNVVALLEGSQEKPVLMLGTHLDVVKAEERERWRFDPFGGVVAEGKIWGRGTVDAKCAIAAHVFAVRALRAADVQLKGSLLCVASVDDEGRFDRLKWPGMTYLAESGFKDAGFPMPDMVINGEASGLQSICGSFKGRIIMEIEVAGETAHAATPYGVNAIDNALALIEELKKIPMETHPLQGEETFTICAVRGAAERYGDIPPSCSVGCEVRVVPPHGTPRVLAEIDGAIERLKAADPDLAIKGITVFSDRQPIEFPADSPLITGIEAAARDVGVDAKFSAILGTGELQAFVSRGIPGVTYGGGHIGRVHKVDECLEIEELVRQAKIYALAAVNICGVES
jgi:acetylornithine deacetylase/succinyl-diaminopimelate desuccinylase-like protein